MDIQDSQIKTAGLENADLTASNNIEHVHVRRGSPCPSCGKGIMDFNGLLNLECVQCGYTLVEGTGCS
jgi:ribosomal protein S27AE